MKKKDFMKMLEDEQFVIIEDVNGNTLEKSMIELEREKLELENKRPCGYFIERILGNERRNRTTKTRQCHTQKSLTTHWCY